MFKHGRSLLALACLTIVLVFPGSYGLRAAPPATTGPEQPAGPLAETGALPGASITAGSPGFELLNNLGGNITTSVLSGTLVYAGIGAALKILDVSAPPTVTVRASLPLPARLAYAQPLALSGTTLYARAQDVGLLIFDVANPDHPVLLARHASLLTPQGRVSLSEAKEHSMLVNATMLYLLLEPTPLAPSRKSLWIVDMSNPQAPVVLGSYAGLKHARLLDLETDRLVLSNLESPGEASRLLILDVATPGAPGVLRDYEIALYQGIRSAELRGSILYLNMWLALGDQLAVYSIDNPAGLTLLDSYGVEHEGLYGLAVVGEVAVLCTMTRLLLIDVGDPLNIELASSPALTNICWGLSLSGTTVLLQHSSEDWLELYSIATPEQPMPLGRYGPGTYARGLTLVDTLIYSHGSLGIFDASVAMTPTLLGYSELFGRWPVVVDGAIGYQLDHSWPDKLRTFDMTDPLSPTLLATTVITYGYSNLREDWFLAQQRIFTLGGQTGEVLRAHDVSSPVSPTLAGSYALGEDFFSDAMIGQDDGIAYIVGTRMSGSTCQLLAVDARNPQAITETARLDLPHCNYTITMLLQGPSLYIMSQGYLTSVDITSPTSPQLRSTYQLSPDPATDSGLAIQGSYLYVAYASRLSAVDIADPQRPRLVGAIDLYEPIKDLDLVGGLLYVTQGSQGVRILRASPEQFQPWQVMVPMI
jgi:hypothetical protein